jgi:hypothetical protein
MLSVSQCTLRNRKSATLGDESYLDQWRRLLDLAYTSSAITGERLAATTCMLDAYDRLIGDGAMGPEVARFASMAVRAEEAASLLHAVAETYADWLAA